jgi:HEAT repeat protein
MLFRVRTIVQLTAVLVSLLVVQATEPFCAAQDSDTSYAGKSVNEWIQLLETRLEKETDEDKEACRRAAAALGQIGPAAKDAVPLLAKALQSPSLEVRHFAVDALGRIGPAASGSVPAIIAEVDIAKDHINYAPLTRFRRYAAKALGRIGGSDQEAVRVLEEALENEDSLYRVEAALALWKMTHHEKAVPTLESIIQKDEAEGPFEAIMALLQVGSDANSVVDTLVATLTHNDLDLRRAAAKVLVQLGPHVLKRVAELLSDSEVDTPEEAVYALGEVLAELRTNTFYSREHDEAEFLRIKEFVFVLVEPALIPLLSHKRDEVRAAASRSLAHMGILAAPLLLPILDGEDQQARESAIDTLERLEQYLPTESPASEGVEQVKRELVKPLMALMGHTSPKVRRAAYRAFAEFSFGKEGMAAMPLLLKALRDPDAAIRSHATKARDALAESQGEDPTN